MKLGKKCSTICFLNFVSLLWEFKNTVVKKNLNCCIVMGKDCNVLFMFCNNVDVIVASSENAAHQESPICDTSQFISDIFSL